MKVIIIKIIIKSLNVYNNNNNNNNNNNKKIFWK